MRDGRMYTCRSCAHWQPPSPDRALYSERPTWGFCGQARQDYREATAPNTLALACDLEACSAWLETAPEFGCVMFQVKAPVDK